MKLTCCSSKWACVIVLASCDLESGTESEMGTVAKGTEMGTDPAAMEDCELIPTPPRDLPSNPDDPERSIGWSMEVSQRLRF